MIQKKYLHVSRRILLHRWLHLANVIDELELPHDSEANALALWPPPSMVIELLTAVRKQHVVLRKLSAGVVDESRLPPLIPDEITKILTNRLKLDVRWFVPYF